MASSNSKPSDHRLSVSLSLLSSVVVLLVASSYLYYFSSSSSSSRSLTISSETQPPESEEAMTSTAVEIFGVKIEKNVPKSKLDDLAVSTWPKWGCQPSKFPWTFEATETMYLLEGKVDVSVDGREGTFQIGAGDLVVFPKGMKIQWDVLEAVNKHYSLDK